MQVRLSLFFYMVKNEQNYIQNLFFFLHFSQSFHPHLMVFISGWSVLSMEVKLLDLFKGNI